MMSTMLSVTVTAPSTPLDKKSAEAAFVLKALAIVETEFGRGNGTVTSGTMQSRNWRRKAKTSRGLMSPPLHPGREALQRLARRYVRHFRRDLVRERQYLEIAAKWTLIAGAAP